MWARLNYSSGRQKRTLLATWAAKLKPGSHTISAMAAHFRRTAEKFTNMPRWQHYTLVLTHRAKPSQGGKNE